MLTVALVVLIGFLGYGLVTKEDNQGDENLSQEVVELSLSLAGNADIKDTMEGISNSYSEYNPEVKVHVTEQENIPLVEGVLNGDYDIVIMTEEIKDINLDVDETLYSELLFGTLVESDQEFPENLIYCYVLNEKIGNPEINKLLQYFYSQPLAFVNNEEVYALQPNIYEESLNYIKIFNSNEQ